MCLSILIDYPERLLEEGFYEGFKWQVTHNGIGYRCGYIKVPSDHPWYGKNIDHRDINSITVHGSITFAKPDIPCTIGEETDDNGYWLGFDAAHAGDLADLDLPFDHEESKQFQQLFSENFPKRGTIKTTEYMIEQCQLLCLQAVLAAKKSTGEN